MLPEGRFLMIAKAPDNLTVQLKVSPALKAEFQHTASERKGKFRSFLKQALWRPGVPAASADPVDRRKTAGQ